MTDAVMVRYQTTVDAAETNRGLVQQVYAELRAKNPAGFRYVTIQLADGVSFVHLAITGDGESPLAQIAAFQTFQQDLADRVLEPPMATAATVVGSYGF